MTSSTSSGRRRRRRAAGCARRIAPVSSTSPAATLVPPTSTPMVSVEPHLHAAVPLVLPDVDVLDAAGRLAGASGASPAARRALRTAATTRRRGVEQVLDGLGPDRAAGRCPAQRAHRAGRRDRRPVLGVGGRRRACAAQSSTAANSRAASCGCRADLLAAAPAAHRRIHRAGSGSKRTRSRPSRSTAPTTRQRRSALGRASTRRWPATVTTSSSPERPSSSSSRRASGRASDSSKPSAVRATVIELVAGRPSAAGSSSPYSSRPERGQAARPTGSAAPVRRHEHRQRRRRRPARPPSCSACAAAQPARNGSSSRSGRRGWRPARRRGSRTAPARSGCAGPRRRRRPRGSARRARTSTGRSAPRAPRSSSRCSRSTASKRSSRGTAGPDTRDSSGRTARSARRCAGKTRSTYQDSASGSASSRSVSPVGAQSTTTRSHGPVVDLAGAPRAARAPPRRRAAR